MEPINGYWGPVFCLKYEFFHFGRVEWDASAFPFSDVVYIMPSVWWWDVPMPALPAVRRVWPQVATVLHSKSVVIPGGSLLDVDPPKAPRDTIFKQAGDHFVQKCSCRLHVHSVSMGVLAFCTKDSAVLTMPLFSLCDVKARRATGWSCSVVSASSCYMSDKVKGYSDMNMGKSCRPMEGKSQWQLRLSGLRAAISVAVVQKRKRNVRKRKENSLSSVE